MLDGAGVSVGDPAHSVATSFAAPLRPPCSILERCAHPWDLLLAAGRPWQAAPGHAASRRVLRRAAQGPGKDVPEAEVHQQARPQEAGGQAWPQGFTGESIFPPGGARQL